MKEIKVFYSQPMHGFTNAHVKEERIKMQQEFREFLEELGFEDYIIVDVNDRWDKVDLLPYVPGRLYWLGRSISQMDRADYVCFHKDWRDADGCNVEMSVAHNYFEHEINLRPRDAAWDPDVYNDFDKTIEIIFWGNKGGSRPLTNNDS